MRAARPPIPIPTNPVIPDLDPPTAEEERDLTVRIRAGDRAAREEMIVRNMKLIAGLASREKHRGFQLADRIGWGCLALVRAVDGFDPGRGIRFSTYLTTIARREIGRGKNRGATIPVPDHLHDLLRSMDVGRPARVDPGRAACLADAAATRAACKGHVEVGEDHVDWRGGGSAGDHADANANADADADADEPGGGSAGAAARLVDSLLGLLPPEEREAVESRHGLNGRAVLDFAEIAAGSGVSAHVARKRYGSGMGRMRRAAGVA